MQSENELEIRQKESYSSLSLIKQCPYRYKLRYVDKIFKQQNSISLDIGTLCHKVLELQRDPDSDGVSYDYLMDVLENGYYNNSESIKGLKELREEYSEDFILLNPKSGLNYTDKINTFKEYIKNYQPDTKWKTLAVELPFYFSYRGFSLTGKIDRLDIDENGHYKVTDYKTANLVYEDKDLKTPLQMYIYALAIEQMYGEMPIEFEYDFVVLGEKRLAMSKGWESRGKKILDRIVDNKDNFYSSGEFPPKPCALCYFCDFRNEECEYYSLWTPSHKTFEVNKEYKADEKETSSKKEEFIW